MEKKFDKAGWYWVTNEYNEVQIVEFVIDNETTELDYKRRVYITRDERSDKESNYTPIAYLGKNIEEFNSLYKVKNENIT